MSDKDTINRRPFRAIGFKMPRCALRFGEAPCTATGTPKCHNLYWTCKDKENYTPTGAIEYVFTQSDVEFFDCYSVSGDGNTIRTGGIPALISAQATPTEINIAARSEGSGALGVRSTISARISAVPDSLVQPWSDYYLADRGSIEADFWQVMDARTNGLYPGAEVFDYQGYVGQDLDHMQRRRYSMESVSVSREGSVSLSGRDPIMKALQAEYPRATDIALRQDIDDSTTTILVSAREADLDDEFGNTAPRRFVRIGSEIIRYTGFTGSDGDYTLTGVTRGALSTEAASHKQFDPGQRCARHEAQTYYDALRYITENHTPIPDDVLNSATWETEGERWLSTALLTGTIAEPLPYTRVAAELARDGIFNIWWDERGGELKLRALRPPYAPTDAPVILTDEANIELMTPRVERKPDERITRVDVLYNPRNPVEKIDFANAETRRIKIDAEMETDAAGGDGVLPMRIESRWITANANALRVSASIARQYKFPPQYVTIRVDAKDRDVETGDVVDLTTRLIMDTEGNPKTTRWLVKKCDDVTPGTRLELLLQSYEFEGRFAVIMPNDAPSHADATEAELAFGCWMADETTGLMPNGDEPYLLY